MMVIATKRYLTLKVVFTTQLCPVPASLFDSYSHMGNPDTKCLLVTKCAVYTDAREKPDIVVIDGSVVSAPEDRYQSRTMMKWETQTF